MNIEQALPIATREVVVNSLNEFFKTKLQIPKKMNKFLIGRAIDLVVAGHQTVEQAQKAMGLLRSEVEFVVKAVDEFMGWANYVENGVNRP